MLPTETALQTAPEILLQRVVTTRPERFRPLYWRASAEPFRGAAEADLQDDGTIRIGAGTTLHFDTYFGALFEQHWRAYTRVQRLTLRVDVVGPARIRLWRRTTLGNQLVHERAVEGGRVEVDVDAESGNFRMHGALVFSVTASDTPVTFRSAAWVARVPAPAEMGLAAVFCTFNREAEIAHILRTLASDLPALERLARIVVVNQGAPRLAERLDLGDAAVRLGSRLRFVDQPNFGGAGGFTRGLMAALDDPEATHAVLIDDDVRIEPESIARLAAFFATARSDMPVGGHMLDLLQPTKLFEAGAIIAERNWSFQPNHHMLDLASDHALAHLANEPPTHYNGWWFFGIPLALLREVGLPLPVFIRGDDMEFGLRLHQRGIYTVPLPGVAVWHEPFYVKYNNWQLYYETRNMLVTASLHLEVSGAGVAWRMLKHMLLHVLTFRYYGTELILRAISDFMQGPAILDRDPRGIHASLADIRAAYPAVTIARATVLPWQEIRHPPRSRLIFKLEMARALLRNAVLPTRRTRPRRLDHVWFAWVCLLRADHVAVDTGWEREMNVFHRSRETFCDQMGRGMILLWRLARGWTRLSRSWQDAMPRLTAVASWRRYLGIEPARAEPSFETAPPLETVS